MEDKVSNYRELDLPDQLDPSEMYEKQIPSVPDREPPVPQFGWIFRVAKPFIPETAKRNVIDAVNGGAVSSATHWVDEVGKLLSEFLHLPVVQPCSNCYSAIQLALLVAGIGSGDSVVVPSIDDDCSAERRCFSPGCNLFLQTMLLKRTILVLKKFAQLPDTTLRPLSFATRLVFQPTSSRCASENGWFLFEDVSECLGVRIRCSSNTGESLRRLGSFGDFSCGSLYANKIVSAGDGGFVGATDRRFQSKLQRFVNHGFIGSYHFLHFESAPNAKINGLGAALACGALENIQEVLDHRSMVSAVYRSELQHLVSAKLIPECGVDDTPWVFGMVAPSKAFRSRMRRMLARRGIESRDYFFSNSLQLAFTTTSPSCPEAHALGSRGLYLPTHVCLTRDDVRTIAACVESCWELVVAGVDKFEFRRQVDRVVRSLSVRVALCASESGLEVREYNYSGEVACTYNKQHHPLLRLQTLVQQMRQFFASSESSEEARRLHKEALMSATKVGNFGL